MSKCWEFRVGSVLKRESYKVSQKWEVPRYIWGRRPVSYECSSDDFTLHAAVLHAPCCVSWVTYIMSSAAYIIGTLTARSCHSVIVLTLHARC